MVQEVYKPATNARAKLSLKVAFPNQDGKFVLREIGFIPSKGPSRGDEQRLDKLGWAAGDYMDVAVMT